VSDSGLVEAFEDLFAAVAEQARADSAAAGGLSRAAWEQLAEAGVSGVSVSEDFGGSGGDLADAYELLYLAGRHALPLPLAEAGALGGWLLTTAGRPVTQQPIAVAPGTRDDDGALTRRGGTWELSGSVHRVPWGASAELVLLVLDHEDEEHLVLVPAGSVTTEPGRNLAGEPRDRVLLDGVTLPEDAVVAVPAGTREELLRRGAMCRAVLMAGALARVAELTVEYAGVREQFGKPIARFQAVAQNLAQLAEHTERAKLGVLVSARMAAAGGHDVATVARAKVLAGEAARVVSTLAHQVHGAMGMTAEYPLGSFTQRLWSWTAEYGSDATWARRLGALAIGDDRPALWSLVTAGLDVDASAQDAAR
jgi:acyl-CoA dehydrogenase